MATYAKTTNPFLKGDTSPINGLARHRKKNAPGMARQQKFSQESNINGLTSPGTYSIATFIFDDNNNSQAESNNNTIKPNSLIYSTPKPIRNDLDDTIAKLRCCNINHDCIEITKTCEHLVNETVRRELEESKNHQEKQKHPHESYKKSRSHQSEDLQSVKFITDEDDDADLIEEKDSAPMETDDRRYQHIELIKKLRLQLKDLERYAYERGELEEIPSSVIAERQTVILETLKDKLSLNINSSDIEKSNIDQLKRQIDKEIQDLIDPMMSKECLLGQLKTQLIDLERYIAHLHETIGKKSDNINCPCHLHGCDSPKETSQEADTIKSNVIQDDSLPRTSRLIRTLITQLICSDVKLQQLAKKEKNFQSNGQYSNPSTSSGGHKLDKEHKALNFHDGAAWSLHIDKVTLATDSLVNLLTLEPRSRPTANANVDRSLVESIVRRQLVPSIKELLTYGLIDPDSIPKSTSYISLLIDPYYLLSSLTCFPMTQSSSYSSNRDPVLDKFHVWDVIEEYYKSRSGPDFKNSSIKTLSQSFNLAPSISGQIKITSKQSLLITIDEIIETLAGCKPNGPESHFRVFVYNALNKGKLSVWLRLIFRNKSILRNYYHNFSFVNQQEKMDKFLSALDALNQFEFELSTDMKSVEQFVSAF